MRVRYKIPHPDANQSVWPNDNYDLLNSHFLPALIKKAHSAKENGENSLEVWGTGTPRRELLYVDDLADACVYFMEKVGTEYMLNIGTGEDHTIREIAERVMSMVGLEGKIVFDTKKPDGTPRKLLDVSLAIKMVAIKQTLKMAL